MEASADYFLMINTVPRPHATPARTASSAPRGVRARRVPAGFVSWRETPGEDRDAFHRSREQTLCDVLDNCFGMCGLDEPGGGYLGFVAAQLENAASWQQAESALFGARRRGAAAAVVRARQAWRASGTGRRRARAGTDAFLRQTLTRIGDAGLEPGTERRCVRVAPAGGGRRRAGRGQCAATRTSRRPRDSERRAGARVPAGSAQAPEAFGTPPARSTRSARSARTRSRGADHAWAFGCRGIGAARGAATLRKRRRRRRVRRRRRGRRR